MAIQGPEADVGIIVARFQVPYLSDGHHRLIQSVKSRHTKLTIVLGISRVLCSRKDPLDFSSRKAMLQEDYPTANIIPLTDQGSDKLWSSTLDTLIRSIHPVETVALYGGRDSFIAHYVGRFKTVPLEDEGGISGTQIREASFHDVKTTEDFRRGVCYATANQYPKVIPTVDVAITKGNMLLLGKKKGESGWRFPGGYAGLNETYEGAGRREAQEETGATLGKMTYVASCPIDDWRYRGSSDQIKTILFHSKFVYGNVQASDDLDEIKWFELPANGIMIVPEHQPLFDTFLAYFMKTEEKCSSTTSV